MGRGPLWCPVPIGDPPHQELRLQAASERRLPVETAKAWWRPPKSAQLGEWPGGLGEAGVGAAGGTVPLLQAAHRAGDLQACRHLEAATPHLGDREGSRQAQKPPGRLAPPPPILGHRVRGSHCEGRQQGLCELGLEGVQQLFGAGIVEGQEAWSGRQRDGGPVNRV